VLKGDQGDQAGAEALLSRSIELAGTLEAWPTIAQAQLALAEHWSKAGKFDRAGEAADAAISIYQRLGCDALAQKAQAMRQIKFGNAV
jgi:hypothetical protein